MNGRHPMIWSIDTTQARSICRTADEQANAIDNIVGTTVGASTHAEITPPSSRRAL